jgi:steroid delta-isomerase-like uncharacterized protein
MSAESNKTTLRRFFEELFNEGNLEVAGEIVAEDYVNHNPAPGEPPGLEGLKAFIAGMRTSFPDGHFSIDDQIAEGDKAVTRWTFHGTHKADFAGIPATGKRVTFSAINIHRVVDGVIQDGWLKWDTLDFMQQLGVIPTPG